MAYIAIVLHALLAVVAHAQAPPPAGLSLVNGVQHMRVCLAKNQGFVDCDPSRISGVDVEGWRAVMVEMGWIEVADAPQQPNNNNNRTTTYSFGCTGQTASELISVLMQGDGSTTPPCNVAIGGITISSQRREKGVRFSATTLQDELAAVVRTDKARATGRSKQDKAFAVFTPMSTASWVLLIILTFTLPGWLSWAEFAIQGDGTLPGKTRLVELWWIFLHATIKSQSNPLRWSKLSFSSKLVMSGYALFLFNFSTAYMANLTASQVGTTFTLAPKDLARMKVEAHDIYVTRLFENDGISASSARWNGDEWFKDVAKDIISGALGAYIVDRLLLQSWMKQNNQDCELTLLQFHDPFEPFEYGWAYSPNTSNAIIVAIDTRLERLKEANFLKKWKDKYLSSTDLCSAPGSSDIGLGVMYIIFGTIGLSAMMVVCKWCGAGTWPKLGGIQVVWPFADAPQQADILDEPAGLDKPSKLSKCGAFMIVALLLGLLATVFYISYYGRWSP